MRISEFHKKIIHVFPLMLFTLLSMQLLFPQQVQAQEQSIDVFIPMEAAVSEENKKMDTEFQIHIEAVDTDTPLPGQTNVRIKNSGKEEFGPITYTVPGDYRYKIYQQAGSVGELLYDDTVYTVTVRVVNGKDGSLSAEIWAVQNNTMEKTDKIQFINKYKKVSEKPKPAPAKVSAAKTGDKTDFSLWLAAFFVSGCIGLAAWRIRRSL
ncbi:Spy0128 family protein [Novisyntrophococcus fermenticellae]|uniref:Spy0128 family protein n=1 Tax=Novisyntrophococcus fermenticellae TaxID=2068655 RepID=UPI001E3B2EF2|nr:FctA domain-containing protein [Novisyntrophococcus fermenticellae]